MQKPQLASNSGLTLVEIVLAVAIFATAVGITASALSSFYVQMDVQEQRIEAIHSCREVLAALREKRAEFELPNHEYDWQSFLGYLDAQNDDAWPDFLRAGEYHDELKEHALVAECLNMDGNPAAAGDNPIQVIVSASWLDRKGRAMDVKLATVLTSQ